MPRAPRIALVSRPDRAGERKHRGGPLGALGAVRRRLRRGGCGGSRARTPANPRAPSPCRRAASFPGSQTIARPTHADRRAQPRPHTMPNVAVTVDSFTYISELPRTRRPEAPGLGDRTGPRRRSTTSRADRESPAGQRQDGLREHLGARPAAQGQTRLFSWLVVPVKPGACTSCTTSSPPASTARRRRPPSGGGRRTGALQRRTSPPRRTDPRIWPSEPGADRAPGARAIPTDAARQRHAICAGAFGRLSKSRPGGFAIGGDARFGSSRTTMRFGLGPRREEPGAHARPFFQEDSTPLMPQGPVSRTSPPPSGAPTEPRSARPI